MLPSNVNLNIKTGTVGTDGEFSLGKNSKVNALEPTPK